jgi:hypothetical protein
MRCSLRRAAGAGAGASAAGAASRRGSCSDPVFQRLAQLLEHRGVGFGQLLRGRCRRGRGSFLFRARRRFRGFSRGEPALQGAPLRHVFQHHEREGRHIAVATVQAPQRDANVPLSKLDGKRADQGQRSGSLRPVQQVFGQGRIAQHIIEAGALARGKECEGGGIRMADGAVAGHQQGCGRQQVEGFGDVVSRLPGLLCRGLPCDHEQPCPAIRQGVDRQPAGDRCRGTGRGEMEQGLIRMAPGQRAGRRHDPPDAGLLQAEGPVEQVEEGLAAEKPDAGRVCPDNPGTRRVPKPGRFGNVPQVIQRGGRHVSQLVTLPVRPSLRWLNQKRNEFQTHRRF